MAGTHGDLFREIGALVVAAHEGDPIDLRSKAGELAERYVHLRFPADSIARAIASSAGAVGVSMAMMQFSKENGLNGANGDNTPDRAERADGHTTNGAEKSPAMLLPSGVRLAVLS